MINMVDVDGDGQVDLEEFAKMVFRYADRVPGGML
jgi:Ca2+-binding EF-hand superfamily protein